MGRKRQDIQIEKEEVKLSLFAVFILMVIHFLMWLVGILLVQLHLRVTPVLNT